jgi:two-component system CheB/CheR fusion protein
VAVIAAHTAPPIAQVLRALPDGGGFAVVVQCAADPAITESLRPFTALPITEARGRIRLEPNRVFAIAHDHDAGFQRNELVVARASEPRAPVDKLLRSLADEHGSQAIAVLLLGRGSDGALGVKRLKEVGALTIAQAIDEAALDGDGDARPTANPLALAELVDLVLPLSAIGERVAALVRQLSAADPESSAVADPPPHGPDRVADTLHDILVLMRVRSGHDFSSYKRATLYRRISRRMQVCQCESIAAYLLYLREHPSELGHLLRDFLISVTNFFRDKPAFDALASDVIPRLFAGKTPEDQVRVWVSGCATGEEAYSIGMLLWEHAGRNAPGPQLQIFATDIDEDALAEARIGRYPSTIAADVSPERLARFFTHDSESYRVTKQLRESVLFSLHNLLRDPPFSRLDLISCRNVLIYLNREAQDRVLNVFHFGLRPDGYLLLGSSEAAENTAMFTGLDAKHRLFARRPTPSRFAGDSLVTPGQWYPRTRPMPAAPTAERSSAGELHYRLVEQYAPPSVLVNGDLDIIHFSENAGRLFQLSGGEPSRQLLRLVIPPLRAELRTAIYAAQQPGRRSDTRIVRFDDAGAQRTIEIRVRAIDQPELGRGSLLVLFDELELSPGSADLAQPSVAVLEPVMRELEDELHRTRDQLRTTIEQYETSLEELKASNEELQAINEELRSATEELETSKEELQSVNEELTTLNHELNLKVDEVSRANSDLQNLMTSTDIAVVFLDRALNIKRFTPRAQDLFNVIPSDIGRPLAHLTHQLEIADLPQLANSVLQSLRGVERELRSRSGRRYIARLLPYRSLEDRIEGVVLTFVEVTDLRDAVDARQRSEAALHTSAHRLRFALRSMPMLVISQDPQLRTTWGYVLDHELEAGSSGFTDLLAPGHAEQYAALAHQVLRSGDGQRGELDVLINGDRRTYDFRIERSEHGIDTVGFDITPSKLAEASLLDADRRKDEFLATLSHELRNPLTPLKIALDIAKLAAGDPDRLERNRAIMERQVAQLSRLVDDLLDLSRITQGKISVELVPLNPALVVEAALEAVQPLIQQRHHQVEIALPSPPVHVLGDQARLTQVLTNLLNNSAKYTPDGGHIAIRLEADPARTVLRIRVRDDGEGIPEDMLSKIFDIFVQCRDPQGRVRGGLGIGLNLVRRLVDLHGGRVSAASAGIGRGSEFTVELPLAAGQS